MAEVWGCERVTVYELFAFVYLRMVHNAVLIIIIIYKAPKTRVYKVPHQTSKYKTLNFKNEPKR